MNSATGEPVRKALVTVFVMPPDTGQTDVVTGPQNGPNLVPALTDAAGGFRFTGLAAGRYLLNAQKPGFQANGDGMESVIEIGPSADNISLRLAPFAKIHGAVTESEGSPVAGAAIRAFYSQIVDGRRTWKQSRSVTTDDLGHYRLWNLEPGSYYLLAAGRGGITQLYVGNAAASVNSHEGFAPIYYGGAKDRASATAIPLTAGQEFEANLEVTLQPAARIRGKIRNAAPYQQITVELLRGGQDVGANRTTVNAATGQFELQDVVPGSYLLRASQGSGNTLRRGQREIQVSTADVEGIDLDLAAGVDVAANVQMSGGRRMCVIRLVPEEGSHDAVLVSVPAGQEGRLLIRGVFPGRYRAGIIGAGGYVSSAVSGDADLLHGGVLVVSAGAPPPSIEIVLNSDGGRVTGTAPASDLPQTVLLVPAAGGDPIAGMSFQGRFTIQNVAPGEYQAYLLGDANLVEYRNPEVLRNLRNGQTVVVTAGATATLDLKELSQ